MPLSAASMLGPRLVNNVGADVPTTSLRGKVVALYFSASWCGPCRGFTPQLVKTYTTLKAAGKAFEVVLIGSDKTEDGFEKYLKQMPWLAVPFDDRDRKTSLSTKFRVHGIPTLIVLDIDGSVITAEGREQVGEDPQGDRFPWRPKPMSDLIGTVFQTKTGLRGVEAIQGKTLALYFSAHWVDHHDKGRVEERLRRLLRMLPGCRHCVRSCPPCRGFTPHLVKTYKAIKEREGGDDVQFLFVSSDKEQGAFDDYFAGMPWLAIPFADSRRRKALGQRFGVRGIPALATVGPDGVIINQTAKPVAAQDPKGLDFPWRPKPVEDLSVCSQSNGFHIQEMPTLVVFMEGADDHEQKEVEDALLPFAEVEVKAGKESGEPALIFFTAKSEADVPTQVRAVCGLKTIPETPQMVIINVPSNGAFYFPEEGPMTAVNSESIGAFISAYKAGSLTRQQLTRG